MYIYLHLYYILYNGCTTIYVSFVRIAILTVSIQTHGFPDQLEKYNDCYTTYLNPIIVVGQMYNNLN